MNIGTRNESRFRIHLVILSLNRLHGNAGMPTCGEKTYLNKNHISAQHENYKIYLSEGSGNF